MSAKEDTEEVLKKIHTMLADAPSAIGAKGRVIVEKEELQALLTDLTVCVNEMMDEHEISDQGKARAEREQKRKHDEAKKDAKGDIEDIYAASMIYSEQSLERITEVITKSEDRLDDLYKKWKEDLKKELTQIRSDKSELEAAMNTLKDSDKYLKLIENENARRKKNEDEEVQEKNPYAGIKPEIKVNPAYFQALGQDVPI